MTTKVLIKHEGGSHPLTVEVMSPGGSVITHDLMNGEQKEFYVYRGQTITVTETENNNG